MVSSLGHRGRSNSQRRALRRNRVWRTYLKAPISQCGYRCDALQQLDACAGYSGGRRAVLLAVIGDTPGTRDAAREPMSSVGAFGVLANYEKTADR